MRICSFSPVVGIDPQVLILGSIPGIRSLQLQQYYAHPQNSFWRILGDICKFDPELDYPTRLGCLTSRGIALWDTLQACERSGSMDDHIQKGTEVPNDVAGLLVSHPTIRAVAFNGGRSWQAFERRILPAISEPQRARFLWRRLPSTSPANARTSFNKKLELWNAAIAPFLQ